MKRARISCCFGLLWTFHHKLSCYQDTNYTKSARVQHMMCSRNAILQGYNSAGPKPMEVVLIATCKCGCGFWGKPEKTP